MRLGISPHPQKLGQDPDPVEPPVRPRRSVARPAPATRRPFSLAAVAAAAGERPV
jgi:hypothetical protein